MSSYWLDSDEDDLEEYIDAALFVDVHNAVDSCRDQMVTDDGTTYECGREPQHPGRHAFIDLVGEDRIPVVLAAWPGCYRPGEGDDVEVMPV